MLPEKTYRYLFISLEGTPAVLRGLLGRYASDDPIWDRRPDPERFTLREMVAHIADWDSIFLQRLQRTATEDNPTLADMDEGQLAIDRDYARQDPVSNLDRFARERARLMEYVRTIPREDFSRPALRPELGPMTIAQQLMLILCHDGYHTRQAAEYAG